MIWLRKFAILLSLSAGVSLLYLSYSVGSHAKHDENEQLWEAIRPSADETDVLSSSRNVTRLLLGSQMAGVISLLVGLVLIVAGKRTAVAKNGVPVASSWFRLFVDAINFCFSLFLVAVTLDAAWVLWFGQETFLGLTPPLSWHDIPYSPLHIVASIGLFVVLPLFTLWTTHLAAQSIEVGPEGVTSHGALRSVFIAWADMESVSLRSQQNPFGGVVQDHRSLQKVVDLVGRERTLTINEPQSRKRKLLILESLLRFAPRDKESMIRDLVREW